MIWKIKHWLPPVLMVPVLVLLVGCSGLTPVGGVRIDELPQNVVDPCPHPSDVIATVRGSSVGSDELRMGRLGDALIECGQEKEIAIEGWNELSSLVR